MNGIFSISLDFELHWGGFEKWPLAKNGAAGFKNGSSECYDQYFLNTRNAILEMLRLFEQYKVHVTWATVGMLFHESKQELLANAPVEKPTYKISELSAYNYISSRGIGSGEADDPFHFAPSLIRKILCTPFQELGTHTFAHFYCNEDGQNSEQFRADLNAAQRVAGKFGTSLKSLVFPRNQFNDEYLKVCFEEGITCVRSNPLDWFWHIESTQKESVWKRVNRGLDAYLPIGKKNTYKLDEIAVRAGRPICLPASRLLRPYNPREFYLNSMKVDRIKNEMQRAAAAGETYHLWWHPHNFGNFPEQSLNALEKILKHFQYCADKFGMSSMNMAELSETLTSSHSISE